jgi:uncharacterized protein YbcC (UPF0753/DUF2309 family)
MQTAAINIPAFTIKNTDRENIPDIVMESFGKITPFWPLKNLIAVNPLHGLEDMPIEEALKLGMVYFQQADLQKSMEAVNRETIKWLQAYFDDGQATITMPFRKAGFYRAWRQLAVYDVKLHHYDKEKIEWLRRLPEIPEQIISECLLYLNIAKQYHKTFLTLMLTTLPGWASYIKYRTEWARLDVKHPHPITQADYLAMRLTMTALLWPEAKTLLEWHKVAEIKAEKKISVLAEIQKSENNYRLPLLKKLAKQPLKTTLTPEAQLIFCIDVRSEPFRKALEATGNYQTLGFAGFFGIPVQITNTITGNSYASCPVLLSPKHEIKEFPCTNEEGECNRKGYERLTRFKRLYQSMKYTFGAPFALVEGLGFLSGAWMAFRTLAPSLAAKLRGAANQIIQKPMDLKYSIDAITFADQCAYAEVALRMMGLTHHFASLVIFCGHGSSTQNNAYASALDCGACGGQHGGSNARILAEILNRFEVRSYLTQNNINIPQTTRFIAAQHNTTTDEVKIYDNQQTVDIEKLKQNLEKARNANSLERLSYLKKITATSKATFNTTLRSQDWAQVRPEWGLARNTAFIIAPRDITSSINLEGRCFLHSYDYASDHQGNLLTTILTAPMVVAQWINTQYFFSTLDNVAYGGGSKITKNITGKIGIMQGNASDLMTGLPLQSVYSSDTEPYHDLQRLMTVVYAPRRLLDAIVRSQPILKKLFGNGWVQLACIEPDSRKTYLLNRDFTWQITL